MASNKKFWGRLGFSNEGIVKQREFKTMAEAEAYKLGCLDTMNENENGLSDGDFNGLEDYWATASDEPSITEEEYNARTSKHKSRRTLG